RCPGRGEQRGGDAGRPGAGTGARAARGGRSRGAQRCAGCRGSRVRRRGDRRLRLRHRRAGWRGRRPRTGRRPRHRCAPTRPATRLTYPRPCAIWARDTVSPVLTAMFFSYIPSPDRGVWYLGPVPIRAYALCIIAAIIVAILWGERRWQARGGQAGAVTDIAVFAVPFGLVGGRLYHVATDWEKYFGAGGHPINALKIWEGGLGIWGAVLLGGIGAWIGCRVYRIPLPAFGDAIAPAILLAQAIGRLGNYFNQELYGRKTDLPWGLEIYLRFD